MWSQDVTVKRSGVAAAAAVVKDVKNYHVEYTHEMFGN